MKQAVRQLMKFSDLVKVVKRSCSCFAYGLKTYGCCCGWDWYVGCITGVGTVFVVGVGCGFGVV